MPRKLTDFIGKHAGETAWLFGKGPSLDSFDMALAGPLRCAINDVVKEVPGCLYGFACDAVKDWAHVYAPEHVLFSPVRARQAYRNGTAHPACELVEFVDDHDEARLAWSAERLASEGLCVQRGTLGSAWQILAVMGVSKIVCVGIDGGGQHAARKWHTELRHNHADDYNAIRDNFIRAATARGIEIEFYGATGDQLSNGMKTIKILQDCALRGQHCAAGEIIDVSPLDAAALISCGRAIITVRPEAPAPVIETATAAPAPETAAAPANRRKK